MESQIQTPSSHKGESVNEQNIGSDKQQRDLDKLMDRIKLFQNIQADCSSLQQEAAQNVVSFLNFFCKFV